MLSRETNKLAPHQDKTQIRTPLLEHHKNIALTTFHTTSPSASYHTNQERPDMYSILGSTCGHHLRHSHTMPPPPSPPSAAGTKEAAPTSTLSSATVLDPHTPFCASCTFYQSLTSQLAAAERHFATFAPRAWTKKYKLALNTRNGLRALW